MGYKLINVKMVKGSAPMSGLTIAHTWVMRLCQCANFTLDTELTVGNNYYAKLNDTEYCVSTAAPQSGMTNGLFIGLPIKGRSSYTCYGFWSYLLSGEGSPVDELVYKMIVDDDNNLVYHSKIFINEKGNDTSLGFLMTNGGVMNIDSQNLYAPSAESGATPAQIGTLEHSAPGCWKGSKDDRDIFKSNMYGYDTNNNIIIRDHLTYLMSSEKNNIWIPNDAQTVAGSNAFEIIMIDKKKYLHLYCNEWIEIDEILNETIEVVNL